jgi:hypothetical protein
VSLVVGIDCIDSMARKFIARSIAEQVRRGYGCPPQAVIDRAVVNAARAIRDLRSLGDKP